MFWVGLVSVILTFAYGFSFPLEKMQEKNNTAIVIMIWVKFDYSHLKCLISSLNKRFSRSLKLNFL